MASRTHLSKLEEGVAAWNAWRQDEPRVQPRFTHADLSGRDLSGVDFRGAGLFKAKLHDTLLVGANLRQARLVQTEFDRADLSGACVYGASVWDVSLEGAVQRDLIITPPGETLVVVDELEVAQFIYLLLNNQKLRNVIDTITSKVVLILGRFNPPSRKAVLNEIKKALRLAGYLPVLFDFEGPENRNLTETVSTLVHLARLVIADLTDAASVSHELAFTVPSVRVPVATIIQRGHRPYSMFNDLSEMYPWVAPPVGYRDAAHVANDILPRILESL